MERPRLAGSPKRKIYKRDKTALKISLSGREVRQNALYVDINTKGEPAGRRRSIFPPAINNKEGNWLRCRWRLNASDGDGKAEKEV